MFNTLPKESRKEKDLEWSKRAIKTQIQRAGIKESIKSNFVKFLLTEVATYQNISEERKQRLLNMLIAEYAKDILTYEEVCYIREGIIKNISKEEIAKVLGKSRRTIYRHIKKYHMDTLTIYQKTVKKVIFKLKLRVNDGKSFKEIAQELGISQRTLYKYNKKYNLGLKTIEKVNTEKKIAAVKKLYLDGTDPKEIAKEMELSLATIYRYLKKGH